MASAPQPSLGLHSLAAHAGERHLTRSQELASQDYTPTVNPIDTSVTYLYPEVTSLDAALGGDPDTFVYHRYGNPTLQALVQALLPLCTRQSPALFTGVNTSTGMAAVHLALLTALQTSESSCLAASKDCYGASYAMVDGLFPQLGVPGYIVDATDLATTRSILARQRPAALLVESVSNPLLRVADLEGLQAICDALEVALIVDNTFPTPLTCRPLDLGAAMEIHSSTKYIGGHGDAMGGIVLTQAHYEATLRELLKTTGAALGGFEAWLLHRGLKTLPLRFLHQSETAHQLALWLAGHAQIQHVTYPGLPSHPDHELATSQFGGCYGAMIAFDIKGADAAAIFRFLETLRLIQPGTSLGDLYSLILYPAHSSHRALTPEQRQQVGIGDGLVRLSVGIEDVADLQADLDQALKVIAP